MRQIAPSLHKTIIPLEIESIHLRCDKGHNLAFQWHFETRAALLFWSAKATTSSSLSARRKRLAPTVMMS